jgi:hypothetical protein
MAPSSISKSERRRLAAERRARVAERNRPPAAIEPQRFAEKIRPECRAQDVVVPEHRAHRKPSPSPRPVPKAKPEEARAWRSHRRT